MMFMYIGLALTQVTLTQVTLTQRGHTSLSFPHRAWFGCGMHALPSPDQVVVCQHPLHAEGEGDGDGQGEAL